MNWRSIGSCVWRGWNAFVIAAGGIIMAQMVVTQGGYALPSKGVLVYAAIFGLVSASHAIDAYRTDPPAPGKPSA